MVGRTADIGDGIADIVETAGSLVADSEGVYIQIAVIKAECGAVGECGAVVRVGRRVIDIYSIKKQI